MSITNHLKEIKEACGITLAIIAAMSENMVIGSNNKIPWNVPTDMSHFSKQTSGYHIIMGRKTYESIGRPLPKRTMVIITSDTTFEASGSIVVHSPEAALTVCKGQEKVFVIGGAEIYKLFLPLADTLEITKIKGNIEGDSYFPTINHNKFTLIQTSVPKQKKSDEFPCEFFTYISK